MVRMLLPYKHAKSLAYGYRKWIQVLELLKKDSHIVHSSNLELDVTSCHNNQPQFLHVRSKMHGRGWSRKANQKKRMLYISRKNSVPSRRSHACISSWARIDPVSNLQYRPCHQTQQFSFSFRFRVFDLLFTWIRQSSTMNFLYKPICIH